LPDSTLDDVHRSFGGRYSDVKNLTITEDIAGRDELLRVFKSALNHSAPVILCDTRAQVSPFLLETIERTQFFTLASEKSVRVTSLVFPADDDDAMQSLVAGIQQVGTAVD